MLSWTIKGSTDHFFVQQTGAQTACLSLPTLSQEVKYFKTIISSNMRIVGAVFPSVLASWTWNCRFESYNSLIKHKKRLHAPHKVEIIYSNTDWSSNKALLYFLCFIAGSDFLLKTKQTKTSNQVVHRCDQCGKSYSDGKALKAHIQSIHKRYLSLQCKTHSERLKDLKVV